MIKATDNNSSFNNLDLFDLADLLIKMEVEKLEKNIKTDSLIDYNDEIISIEPVGDKETIDITVTGDNLFYCNDILTKNSHGVSQTVDLLIALITSEELEEMDQIMIKQLKNRYNDLNRYKRFIVGIDRPRMKFYDVENSAQKNISDSGNVDKSKFSGLK